VIADFHQGANRPNEALVPILGPSEARRLTDQVKRDAESLWRRLVELYDGGAHAALGYSSWQAYCEAEFGVGRSQSYRLLEAGRVAELVPHGGMNERQARELAPLLRDEDENAVAEVWNGARAEHGERLTAEKVRTAVEKKLAEVPNPEDRHLRQAPKQAAKETSVGTVEPTEKQFMATVIEAAQTLGWLVYHTHDSRRSESGFPDLVGVRRDRILFIEVKPRRGDSARSRSAGFRRSDSPALPSTAGGRATGTRLRRRCGDSSSASKRSRVWEEQKTARQRANVPGPAQGGKSSCDTDSTSASGGGSRSAGRHEEQGLPGRFRSAKRRAPTYVRTAAGCSRTPTRPMSRVWTSSRVTSPTSSSQTSSHRSELSASKNSSRLSGARRPHGRRPRTSRSSKASLSGQFSAASCTEIPRGRSDRRKNAASSGPRSRPIRSERSSLRTTAATGWRSTCS
jgi:hypothetical protein